MADSREFVDIRQPVGIEPNTTVVDEGYLDRQIVDDLALNANGCLHKTWRTAIVWNNERRGRVELTHIRVGARIEVGGCQSGRGVRYAIGKLAGGNAIRRTGEGHLVEAKSLVAIADFIHEELLAGVESRPRMEHGLRIQLITEAETRLNHPGIELLEAAVATPGTIPLVFGSTQQAASRRIRDGRTKLGYPHILFVLHLFEIPTQSVVHREFMRELPGVLRVNPALFAVKPLNVIVPDICAIQLAKSEARETIAEAGSIKVLAIGGRQRRLSWH